MSAPDDSPSIGPHPSGIGPPPTDDAIERKLAKVLTPVHVPRYPLPTVGITVILAIFGLALVFQSRRWSNTPAYGNLLRLMPADAWGGVYLAAAALMVAALAWGRIRWLGLAAHAAALVLLLGWEFAFFIRWLTDSNTTVVNTVSWGVYVVILLRSAQLANARTAAL